jgi:hypothetical protein
MLPRRPVRDLLPQLQALREVLPLQPSSGVDAVRAPAIAMGCNCPIKKAPSYKGALFLISW